MKLSIITINYNNRNGLKKTGESVLSQTWRDFEWIIIDGGSTDGSKEIIEHFAGKCSNISFWCSEPDKGVYNAQNKGICQACGDYLSFMNSGDSFYDPEVLEHVFSAGRTADVVYGDWVWHDADHEELATNTHNPTMAWFQVANICHQAMFIKRDVLKDDLFDESYKLYADWAKWMQFACDGKSFEYVPYIICRFELGGLSRSNHSQAVLELKRVKEIPSEPVRRALREYEKCKKNLDRYERFDFLHNSLCLMEKSKVYRGLYKSLTKVFVLLERCCCRPSSK